MRLLNGRLLVVAGAALAVAGLLVFSLGTPGTTLGQETDVGPGPDVEEPAVPPATLPEEGPEGDVGAGAQGPVVVPAQPPASLPQAGDGIYVESGRSTGVLLGTLLAALGVTLAGAGAIATRRGRRRVGGE